MAGTPASSRGPTTEQVILQSLAAAKGDMIAASAASTWAKLGVGTTGRPLLADSSATPGVAWTPLELDYVAFTNAVACTATSEATANTVVTGNAVTYDGATAVLIEFFSPYQSSNTTTVDCYLWLYDGASSVGRLWQGRNGASQIGSCGVYAGVRLTPSAAAHTYSVRGSVQSASTFTVNAGAGGAGNLQPGFIRILRVAA